MTWQQGIPKKSGLYWLYIGYPTGFMQPALVYAATETHPAIYTTELLWYDGNLDQDGELCKDMRLYDSPSARPVCFEDKTNAYWMLIQQPDPPNTKPGD